jgi:hypothetical protein
MSAPAHFSTALFSGVTKLIPGVAVCGPVGEPSTGHSLFAGSFCPGTADQHPPWLCGRRQMPSSRPARGRHWIPQQNIVEG